MEPHGVMPDWEGCSSNIALTLNDWRILEQEIGEFSTNNVFLTCVCAYAMHDCMMFAGRTYAT